MVYSSGDLDSLPVQKAFEGLDSVIEKIRNCMPEKALEHFADVDVLTYIPRFGRTDHKPHAAKIKVLIEAARNRLSVRVKYRPVWEGDTFETLFDPYGLIVFDGNLFAVGRSHQRDAVRILKVIRIQRIEATDRRFSRPRDFSASNHFEHSFGLVHASTEPTRIVVRFTGKAATLVEERTWHETQQLERVASGPTLFEAGGNDGEALLATFRLAEVSVFKSWIKGFGEHAEVLKPTWLRREVHEELLVAARRYDN
jgi:predicted DNA-binding transcriptional regulator YafY